MKLIVVDQYFRARPAFDYRYLWQRGVKWGTVEHGLSIFAASVLAIRPIFEPVAQRWSAFSDGVSRRCSTRRDSLVSILSQRKSTGTNLWGWAFRRNRHSSNAIRTTGLKYSDPPQPHPRYPSSASSDLVENPDLTNWTHWPRFSSSPGPKALHGSSPSYVCPTSPEATPDTPASFQEGATDYFSFNAMINKRASSTSQKPIGPATAPIPMAFGQDEPGPEPPGREWFDDQRFSCVDESDIV